MPIRCSDDLGYQGRLRSWPPDSEAILQIDQQAASEQFRNAFSRNLSCWRWSEELGLFLCAGHDEA